MLSNLPDAADLVKWSLPALLDVFIGTMMVCFETNGGQDMTKPKIAAPHLEDLGNATVELESLALVADTFVLMGGKFIETQRKHSWILCCAMVSLGKKIGF